MSNLSPVTDADDPRMVEVPILVVHDGWTKDDWIEQFDEDARRRAAQGDSRRLVLLFNVCPTKHYAFDTIDGLEHQPPEKRPQLVLIDHLLQKRAGERENVAGAGPQVMARLSQRYAEFAGRHPDQDFRLPPALLATSRYDHQLAYAFTVYGGRNVVNRNTHPRAGELFAALWATLEGATWSPPQPMGGLELDEREAVLMPLIERALGPTPALQELERLGRLPTAGYTTAEYGHAVGRIAEKLRAARDRLYPPPTGPEPGRADPGRRAYDERMAERRRWANLDVQHKRELAEFAEDCGAVWLRSEYDELDQPLNG
jgi:hypothetical protein